MKNAVYYLPGCGGLLALRRKRLAGFDGSDEAGLAGADFFEVSQCDVLDWLMVWQSLPVVGCSTPSKSG